MRSCLLLPADAAIYGVDIFNIVWYNYSWINFTVFPKGVFTYDKGDHLYQQAHRGRTCFKI